MWLGIALDSLSSDAACSSSGEEGSCRPPDLSLHRSRMALPVEALFGSLTREVSSQQSPTVCQLCTPSVTFVDLLSVGRYNEKSCYIVEISVACYLECIFTLLLELGV